MRVIYIRETKDTCDFIKRIILKIKCLFCIVDKENIGEKTTYNLPIFANKDISKYRINKLSKKVIKILEKDGVCNIVLSKYLSTKQRLRNNFYTENINILDGRLLFKVLTYELVEYLLNIKNKNIQER